MPNGNPSQSTTPRRSLRLLLQHNPNSTKKPSVQSRDCSIALRRSPRLNNGVALRRYPKLSNHKAPTKEQSGEKSCKSVKVKSREAKTKENCAITDEEIAVKGKVRNGDKIEVGAKRKRGAEEIAKGWTKEQELAPKTAYYTAKPSPHFWKNVSKLLRIAMYEWLDCFERIHHDLKKPPQSQTRSRAKTIKSSSPLHQFSISASKLLKPIDKSKTVRRSNFLKQKNCITQKSIEKLLQRHLKVDQDHEGDIFSVFEPNIDFSTNAVQPSQVFSTPKQQKENKGLLQSCTGTSSSSSHKKPLSRFSGSSVPDLVSPPVLKQVKNRVQHEKYINQLRYREAKRRAASARSKMPMTGQIIGEGSNIQKRDAVKAAKIALVSEVRDAISKFQLSQVNFIGNSSSSDEENDDGIGVYSESQ
ncbi:hypothetical protein SESBI_34383 [Sesbania bispinosa]|nr:hypothetical protein SESBI_34383 [Sesbania bispinosa]